LVVFLVIVNYYIVLCVPATENTAGYLDVGGWTVQYKDNKGFKAQSPSDGNFKLDVTVRRVYEIDGSGTVDESGPATSSIRRKTVDDSWDFTRITNFGNDTWVTSFDHYFGVSGTIDVSTVGTSEVDKAIFGFKGGYNNGLNDFVTRNGIRVPAGAVKFNMYARWLNYTAVNPKLVFELFISWSPNIGNAVSDAFSGDVDYDYGELRENGTFIGVTVTAGSTQLNFTMPGGVVFRDADGNEVDTGSIKVVEGETDKSSSGSVILYVVFTAKTAVEVEIDPVMAWNSASSKPKWLDWFL